MTQGNMYFLGCITERRPLFLKRIPNNPIQKGRHLPLSVLVIGVLLVALIALPGMACADDFVGGIPLTTVQSGTVTGDLWFNATPAPDWGLLDVTKTFTLPENVPGNITWSRLYISAYDGHMQDDKAFTITNSFDGNGDGTYEQVWPETGHAPFNYVIDNEFESPTYGEPLGNDNTALGGGAHDRYKMINDHENRVTSDYFMWYDVTNLITSSTVNVNVDTTGSYDGRIKLITLVVAYNNASSTTQTTYWVNQGHDVCSYYTEDQGGADDGASHVAVGSTTFATTGLSDITSATLTVDYMASNNGNYGFPASANNFNPDTKTGDFTNYQLDRTADVQGAYSGLKSWDVTSSVSGSSTTTLGYARYLSGTGTAAFYKIPLVFLVVKSPIPAVTPVAAFTANNTSGTKPLTVAFTDQSTNTPTSWAWTFGDGSTSSEQNPIHTYTSAGTYTVTLTASNSAGSNAVTQTDYITVAVAGSKTWDIYPTDPDGTLDLIMTNVSAGDTVYFHNGNYPTTILGSSHVYNSVPNITWVGESRDGVIINIGSSSLILQQPGYIFKNLTFTQTAAVYSWSVRSSDDLFDNCNFNWTSGGSTAPIIILANSAGTGDHCTITNSTFSNYTDSPISVYSGTDHVIAGNTFRSETKSLIRMANTSSTAWFYLNNVVGTQPKSVLRSTSVAVPTFVSPSAITYTYNGNSYTNVLGNYWPDYNGTDSDGNGIGDTAFVNGSATDTAPLMGVWNNGAITYTASGVVAPVANFTATPTSGTAPLAVTFTDTSTNSPISWSWDFGDGSTSTEQNPSHEYTTAGTYTVALTATNAAGSDGETKTGYVTVISAVGGLADTAWPKFQGNAKNTGLSPYTGPQTSNVLWNTTTGTIYYAAPVIGSDGTVYIGSYSSPYNVYAVNANGTIKWTYLTGGKIYSSAAVGSDGTIYIGCSDNKLYAINADGTLKWSYTAGGAIRSSVAIGSDGTIFFVSMDDYIYALNSDGSLKWKYNVNAYGPYYGSPTIGSDGTIYLGNSNDNTTYALNADGTLKWTYVTDGYLFNSPTVGTDGTIYLGSTDKMMYALNADGTLKWSFTTNDEIYGSPAVGTDGTLYFGSRDYNVYALNADGTLKWSYPTGNYVQSSPVIGSDGTIYIGSFDYNVYALNADGTLKWSYTTGNSVRGSAAIGSDGTLYIGSSDGKLYAFKDAAVVAPVAAFTGTPTSGTAPLTVQFTDASTNFPTNWLWDFGDGDSTNATEQNPVHMYEAAGTYNVSLTATNTAGSNTATQTGYIAVTSGIIALPGQTLVPTDPDGDGLYEDLNGNGRTDNGDVVVFFKNLDWIKANEPFDAFDFNGNFRIDNGDVVILFKEL